MPWQGIGPVTFWFIGSWADTHLSHTGSSGYLIGISNIPSKNKFLIFPKYLSSTVFFTSGNENSLLPFPQKSGVIHDSSHSFPGALTIEYISRIRSHIPTSSAAMLVKVFSFSTGIVAMVSYLPSCFVFSLHYSSSQQSTQDELFEIQQNDFMFLELNLFNHFPYHSRDNPLSSSDPHLDPPTFSCPHSYSHLPLHISQVAQNLLPWGLCQHYSLCPECLSSSPPVSFLPIHLVSPYVSYQLEWSHFLSIFKNNFLVLVLILAHL